VYPLDTSTYPDGNTPAWIWDAATGEVITKLDSDADWTVTTEWSADGEHIVAGYENGVAKVWDVSTALDTGVDTGTVLLTFAGHAKFVWDVTWSPDGTRVVSSDETGLVKVWDPTTGVEFLSFTTQANTVSVNWSPDGNYVMAAGFFYTPIVRRAWQSTETLIAHAKECCVTRELTDAEREQFGLPPR
jgi:WD40 repeat protein